MTGFRNQAEGIKYGHGLNIRQTNNDNVPECQLALQFSGRISRSGGIVQSYLSPIPSGVKNSQLLKDKWALFLAS